MRFVIVVAIAIAFMIVAVVRPSDLAKRAVVLRRAGFWLIALSACFIGAFIIGETFTDPGGWKAAGLVAVWAVPLAGLATLAWFRPGWAGYVLAILTAGVIGVSVWFAVDPESVRSFENQNGPVRVVLTFVLVAAIAVLGLKRTAAAGVLLLTVGVIPVVVASLGGFQGSVSLSFVSAAPVITGVLYLASAHAATRQAPPAHTGTGSAEQPKAA